MEVLFFIAMALPSSTARGSGLTRSEAAILAWKKRQRAAPKTPGGLDPKIAARVKEILAAKQKKGKGKAKPKGRAAAKPKMVDPAKAKAKADREKAVAARKVETEKAKAERATQQQTAKQERDKAKAEKVTAAATKETAKQAKLKQAAGAAKKKKVEAQKPKEKAADPAKKQSDNRAKVAKEMADQDAGLSPGGSAALGAFADGKPLAADTAKQFEAMGLTEQGSDGAHRLTSEGRAAAAAMSRGDTRGAIDAISRAADKKKSKGESDKAKVSAGAARETAKADRTKAQADREKSKADSAAKRDASNARVEAARIEAARSRNRKAIDMPTIEIPSDSADSYTFAIKAGARHSKMDASHLDEASRHLHAAGAVCPDCAPMDDEGDDDTEDAGKAIKGIMDNPAWYASHECNDIMQASSALSTLTMLIQSELSEEDEDDASIAQLCDAARTLVKFIGAELDELEGAAGDAAELPNSANVQTMKGIELAALDNGEEIAVVHGYSVKAIGDEGLVGGYLVKFGGDGDLSPMRDVFTKHTNFGTHTKSDVWVHHRMLPGLGKKQLTNQAELGMDDEGVFVKHLLNLRDGYEAKLYGMVQNGKLGWSSGTAPHLVDRKAMGDGRHEITQWTLGLDASYTPMPAGGFVVNAGAMKSLLHDAGIDLLNAMYIDDSPEAIKANSDRGDGLKAESDRARRLVLDLELMELEETAL